MTTPRFGRVQKATALLPLALLSTAWTASLIGVGGVSTAAADEVSSTLPDGTVVPTQAIEAPASVSLPGVVAPGVPAGKGATVVRTSSTNGIPSAALSAYQRGEAVINSADKGCNIPWQLIAAIGRVESDHGRYGGNVLNDDGVATPGIYGIALDGTRNTQKITDTDAGQYDNDTVYDRAVGPMQFIPTTWSVVAVDADGDGERNPQDMDDAALASAVYLCSGDDDLSTEAGQRKAVYRYNHSDSYVDLVLDLMTKYTQGDFTSVPNNSTSAAAFVPDTTTPATPTRARNSGGQPTGPGANAPTQQSVAPTKAPTKAPTQAPTEAPGTPLVPSGGAKDQGGNDSGAGDVGKNPGKTSDEVTKDPIKEVGESLTFAQAQAQCLATGLTVLDTAKLSACIADLMKP